MKPLLPALLALAVSAPALAAKIAMEDQSQIPPAPAKPLGPAEALSTQVPAWRLAA